MTSREFGRACESAACDYLENKGYTIKARNYTIKGGEIDIVAEDAKYIVFVEVKARSAGYDERRFGRPSDAVNTQKKKHLKKAAYDYLFSTGCAKSPRMDVLEILVSKYENCYGLDIKHYISAF